MNITLRKEPQLAIGGRPRADLLPPEVMQRAKAKLARRNLIAIVVAIFNAFVHSRDAYAVIPAGVWLSVLTVVLLAAAQIVMAVAHPVARIES